MYSHSPLRAVILLSTLTFAHASPCAGQQYNDLPGFPAYQSACYPTNYYQTYDLGQTNPDDARDRCQQYCTSDGNKCQSVVAQVNKAADSNLYSGTCFLYTPGQTVTPRRCADTAYLLEGYYKDGINACFSKSSSAASAYCSSYLSIPFVTNTATVTLPVTTTIVTTTTKPTTTTTVSVTTTPTGTTTIQVSTTPTSTATVTVTTTPIVTTTISVTTTPTTTTSKTVTSTPTSTTTTTSTQTVTGLTSTVSKTTTVTTTVPNTVTSTSTVETTNYPASTLKKRLPSTVPQPACVTPSTPATRLSAACSCLSVKTSTTTTTTTLSQVTNTATSITTSSITITATTTIAAASITSSVTITQTAPSVTTTSTSTVTAAATTATVSVIVTAAQVTTTSTITATDSPTTTTITQTATSSVTPTTTATQTATSTSTSTATQVTTTYVAQCTPGPVAAGAFGFTFNKYCNTQCITGGYTNRIISSATISDFNGCIVYCAAYVFSAIVQYDEPSGSCNCVLTSLSSLQGGVAGTDCAVLKGAVGLDGA